MRNKRPTKQIGSRFEGLTIQFFSQRGSNLNSTLELQIKQNNFYQADGDTIINHNRRVNSSIYCICCQTLSPHEIAVVGCHHSHNYVSDWVNRNGQSITIRVIKRNKFIWLWHTKKVDLWSITTFYISGYYKN